MKITVTPGPSVSQVFYMLKSSSIHPCHQKGMLSQDNGSTRGIIDKSSQFLSAYIHHKHYSLHLCNTTREALLFSVIDSETQRSQVTFQRSHSK